MGDRTSWTIITDEQGEKAVHLYSHWGGATKLEDTRAALEAARPRWGDTSYCARIIVSQIVGDNWASEYGFGLLAGDVYSYPFEEERYYLTLDLVNQWVIIGAENWKGTFDEFVVSDFGFDELDQWAKDGEEGDE